MGCEIIVLNEQWVDWTPKGYSSIITRDKYTKINKINTSMFIKENINYEQLYKDEINNTIFTYIKKYDLYIIGTYLRPDDKINNEIQIAEIHNKISDIKEENPNSKIVLTGDLNRSDILEQWYLKPQLIEHDYKHFSHCNNKFNKKSFSKLTKVYCKNINIKSHVCKELMNTLSDHAGILLQILDKKLDFIPTRVDLPNQRLAQKVKEAISSALSWDDIHNNFYKSKKKLISWNTTKKNNSFKNEIIEKIISDLANGLDSHEIEGKFNETSDNFLKKTAEFIFSKNNNAEGWKNLKNLTKYNLIGKKEGKIVDKIYNNNKEVVTGNCKDRVISEHFKQLHEETIKEFIPLIQKFDFDITVSTNQVIQICEKLSQGKAMAWDCVPDTITLASSK